MKTLRFFSWVLQTRNIIVITDGSRILHTLLVKHFNTLLDRLNSERDKDEVTYFYVGDVFCIHLGTKYADFQEKIFAEISGKSSKFFVVLTFGSVWNIFPEISAKIFSWDFIPAPLRTLSIKQVIVVLY